MDFLYHYGLFLAQAVTIVVAIIAVIVGATVAASKPKSERGELEIEDLGEYFAQVKEMLEEKVLTKEALKQRQKAQKKAQKKEQKNADDAPQKPSLFVVEFEGSVDANEVSSLREEISAILTIATSDDEVLLKIESGGGVVHGYGLAASQISRLKAANIPITVAIDKVAASGGYMMACVANNIICAPFAIVGSIGVVASLPNFNKLLKKNDIDYEQFTAGDYKRTVTVFGENDEKGRAKFNQELEETHTLFKTFVSENRPDLDIETVATGEHWFGTDAMKRGLVDELQTSDDYLMSKIDSHQLFGIKCVIKKSMAEKMGLSMSVAFDTVLGKWWQRSQRNRTNIG
ncbi:MAG: serine protease SohB [Phenylobacterium sp.]